MPGFYSKGQRLFGAVAEDFEPTEVAGRSDRLWDFLDRVITPSFQCLCAIWMRLPQVSSKTAVVTGPNAVGG